MKFRRSSTFFVPAMALLAVAACNPAERARQAKDDVDSGNAAACVAERGVLEQAVQAYMLLQPDAPVTEVAMVAIGYLRQQSVLMDVNTDGTIVPAVGTVCT